MRDYYLGTKCAYCCCWGVFASWYFHQGELKKYKHVDALMPTHAHTLTPIHGHLQVYIHTHNVFQKSWVSTVPPVPTHPQSILSGLAPFHFCTALLAQWEPNKTNTFILLLNSVLHLEYFPNCFTHTPKLNKSTILVRVPQRNRTNWVWRNRERFM